MCGEYIYNEEERKENRKGDSLLARALAVECAILGWGDSLGEDEGVPSLACNREKALTHQVAERTTTSEPEDDDEDEEKEDGSLMRDVSDNTGEGGRKEG